MGGGYSVRCRGPHMVYGLVPRVEFTGSLGGQWEAKWEYGQGSTVHSAIPQGIILVYDITDEKSFENIQNWMKSIKEVRTLLERWGNCVESGR